MPKKECSTADSALLESQLRTFQGWGGNCHSHLACLQGAAKDALHVACLHLLGGHAMEEVAGVVVAIVKSEEGGCTRDGDANLICGIGYDPAF